MKVCLKEKGEKDEKMTKKKKVFIGILAFAVCFFAGLLFFFRFKGDQSVAIKPKGDELAGKVTAYYQRDERWKEDTLGTSGFSMGGSGCLTSCIASALSTEAEALGTGFSITPGELNRIFGQQQVYNAQGDIVWAQIEEALPQTQVVVASSVKEKEIESLLADGHYPIVKVKVGGYGASHWVLLVGSRDGEYLCMDPLEPDGELIPLSRHGGVVYRMRCVYWEEQEKK